MGSLFHWLIFLGGVAISVVLILYSLCNKRRSLVVLVMLIGVFSAIGLNVVTSHRLLRPVPLTLFWLIGSLVGIMRQIRLKSPRYLPRNWAPANQGTITRGEPPDTWITHSEDIGWAR